MPSITKLGIMVTVWTLLLSASLYSTPPKAYSAVGVTKCMECHSDLEVELKAHFIHSPFKGRECSSCHNPHAAKHKGLLLGEPDELCFSCHDKSEILRGTTTHAPAKEGECLACHEAHASSFPKLQKGETAQTCFNCHDKKEFAGAYVHFPVAEGECTACHDPHSTETEKLLNQPAKDLCGNCHDYDKSFTKAHLGYPVAEADCILCHSPHTSKGNKLLKANLHAPFEEKECGICHVEGSRELTASMPELCFGCHSDREEDFYKIETHLVIGYDSCVSCHNPHASRYESLLNDKLDELCFKCHWDTERTIAKSKASHPKGEKSCIGCHNPHGSNYPTMLSSGGVETCDKCHETQGSFSHPVGENAVIADTKIQVNCLSCHKVMGSEYRNFVRLPGTKLCLICHSL